MTRTWFEAGQPMTMQQFVRTVERIGRAELLGENAHRVLATQGANPISIGGTGLETLNERRLHGRIEFWLGPAAGSRSDRINARITIRISPSLDEPAAAGQHHHDGLGRVTIDRQQSRSVSIPLLRVALVADTSLQMSQITAVTFLDVHTVASLLGRKQHDNINLIAQT